MNPLPTFIQFSRPHTIVATTLQVGGLFVMVAAQETVTATSLGALAVALASSLAVNVYIVGLNQITDVEIDRINKPYLPLASGAYSLYQAWAIVLTAGIIALGLAATQGYYLLGTVAASFIIGTIYSLPPVRLKQYPIWAALCIAFVRGVITNLGFYWHYRGVFGYPADRPPLLILWAVLFFFGFGLVIALYKDIPDMLGDKKFHIRTFTVRLGPQRVFNLGRWLLSGFYLVPVTAAYLTLPKLDSVVLLVSHLIALIYFWISSIHINPVEPTSMSRFYLSLWGLFYAEYILLSVNEIARATWLG